MSVEKTTKNAAHMLHVLDLWRDVPLYKGCATPLLRALKPCPEIHGATHSHCSRFNPGNGNTDTAPCTRAGDSGLGGKEGSAAFPPLPDDFPWRAQHAVEGMWQRISCWHHYGCAVPGEGAAKLPEGQRPKVTLMATGALTNVAVLLKTYPAVTRMLEAIVLMGGGFTRGESAARAAGGGSVSQPTPPRAAPLPAQATRDLSSSSTWRQTPRPRQWSSTPAWGTLARPSP